MKENFHIGVRMETQQNTNPLSITTRVLTHNPSALLESFKLRYQVYCLEAKFLVANDYPENIEQDHFEQSAAHIGCYVMRNDNEKKVMAGCVRLVRPTTDNLPVLEHCTIYEQYKTLFDSENKNEIAEISRLCISSAFRNRRGDGLYALDVSTAQQSKRLTNKPVFLLALFKGLYQESLRLGISIWVIAIETGLHRMLLNNGIVFNEIGPEIDYYGAVRPYFAKISDIEKLLHAKDPNYLSLMQQGLNM